MWAEQTCRQSSARLPIGGKHYNRRPLCSTNKQKGSAVVDVWVDLLEVILEPHEVLLEALVGTNYASFLPGHVPGLFEADPVLLHEEGDDEGRRTRDAHLAMHQNVVFFQILLDV
jgi:hypothetical protein